jgi:hypothetical protein
VARGRGGLVRAHDQSLLIGPVVACPSIATLANIRHSFERAVPKVLFATSSTQYALGSPFGYRGSRPCENAKVLSFRVSLYPSRVATKPIQRDLTGRFF